MHIFIDDERTPDQVTWVNIPKVEYHIVRSFNEFAAFISSLDTPPTHISFDHDLGFGNGKPDHLELTGYDCAKFLIELCMTRKWPLPAFTIHSMNPVGAENIGKLLTNAKSFLSLNK